MTEGGRFEEKRAYQRYELHLAGSAEVLYRRDPTPQGDGTPPGGRHYPIDVVNVSLGGFMLAFDAEFLANDVLRMHFTHPETGILVNFEGQVMWVRKAMPGSLGKYCCGVSFKNPPEAVIASLVEFASRLGPKKA